MFWKIQKNFCISWQLIIKEGVASRYWQVSSGFYHDTVVSNHFHSGKSFLFWSTRPCDFDGMLGTGLPVSMYTTKSQSICDILMFLNFEFLTFSLKDRYYLNYFICFKDFSGQTIASLKLILFSFFIYSVSIMKGKQSVLIYIVFLLSDRQWVPNTSIYSAVFLMSPYYNYL